MPISEEEFKQHPVHKSLEKLVMYARELMRNNYLALPLERMSQYIQPYKNALNSLPRDSLNSKKLDEIKILVDSIVQESMSNKNMLSEIEAFYNLVGNYPNYIAKLQVIKEERMQNMLDEFKDSANKKKDDLWNTFENIKENSNAVKNKMDVINTVISQFANQAKQAKKEIENLESEKSEQIVAETYHEEAKGEEKKARFWLKVATGCIATAMANAAMVLYFLDMRGDPNSTLVQIFSISLFLLTGSGISAAFAKFHRNNEKEAKRIALEMSAIQPFIAPLQSVDKKAIISILALKYFSGGQYQNNSQMDASFAEKISEKLIDGIKNSNNDG